MKAAVLELCEVELYEVKLKIQISFLSFLPANLEIAGNVGLVKFLHLIPGAQSSKEHGAGAKADIPSWMQQQP